MKRVSVFLAAVILPFLPLHSQEFEAVGRLDVNNVDKFGNASAVYTVFTSGIGEHFDVQLVNHWVSGSYTPDLYRNVGRSDNENVFNYVTFGANFQNWRIVIGKDMMYSASFENEPWDFDSYSNINSSLWNNLVAYQWGASVAYTTNSEKSTFGLQMVTSPYGEKPFASGLYAFSFQWRGEYGWFSNIWSASAVAKGGGRYGRTISLGQQATAGNWTFGFIWNNANLDEVLMGNAFIASVDWAPIEQLNFTAKGCYETGEEKHGFAGLLAQWTPWDFMRIHATGSYDFIEKNFFVAGGLTFFLNLPREKK